MNYLDCDCADCDLAPALSSSAPFCDLKCDKHNGSVTCWCMFLVMNCFGNFGVSILPLQFKTRLDCVQVFVAYTLMKLTQNGVEFSTCQVSSPGNHNAMYSNAVMLTLAVPYLHEDVAAACGSATSVWLPGQSGAVPPCPGRACPQPELPRRWLAATAAAKGLPQGPFGWTLYALLAVPRVVRVSAPLDQ